MRHLNKLSKKAINYLLYTIKMIRCTINYIYSLNYQMINLQNRL